VPRRRQRATRPPPRARSAELRDKLDPSEADYFRTYSDSLAAYAAESGVDITSDLQAPKESTVEVVALRDCGVLMTTRGPRDVREREVHVMRRGDAEALIRTGVLRHITDRG
jgi:hypothetical protein